MVHSFYPSAEVALDGQIRVTFTSDVISTGTGQTSSTADGLITFDPSVEGYVRWDSQRSFVFKPTRNLRAGNKFLARINPGLRDLKGRRLEGEHEFTFFTRALQFLRVSQRGFTSDRRAILELNFNDPVAPAELYKYVALAAGGDNIGWTVQSDVSSASPRIVTDPVTSEPLRLRITPGLAGVNGPLGIEKPVQHTVDLTFKLMAEKLSASWTEDRVSLYVKFSNAVRLDNAKELITVEPAVPFEIMQQYNTARLVGDFKPETRYTVRIKPGIQGTNDSIMLREATLSVWVPVIRPFLQLLDAGGHLSTAGTMKLRVKSAGLKKINVRMTRLYDNNYAHFAASGGQTYDVDQYGDEIASREVLTNGEYGKPVITEVDLRDVTKGQTGVYNVTVSGVSEQTSHEQDDADGYDYDYGYRSRYPSDKAVISISNIGLIAKTGRSELVVWSGALDSAQPLAGTRIHVFTRKNQPVGEAITDSHGMARIPVEAGNHTKQPAVIVASREGDVCYLDLNDTLAGEENMQSSGREYLDRGYELFLSAERGAYRPGETVHLFGYIRGKDGRTPPAAFPLELTVRRPDGKAWEPRIVTPGTSGTMTCDVVVPEYAQLGLYNVSVSMPGTKEDARGTDESGDENYSDTEGSRSAHLGSSTFFVEEFLPNRLKVDVAAPETRLVTSDTLAITVKAEEMFGQPAAGRTVSAVATFRPQAFSTEKFPDFTFGDSDIKFESREEELEDVTVGEDGLVTVTLEAPGLRAPAAVQATVQVTVKDVGGRSVTNRLQRSIDPVPFYIGVKPRSETYAEPGKPAEFDIVIVAPDGNLVEGEKGDQALTATISQVHYNSIMRRDNGYYHFETSKQLLPLGQMTVSLQGGRGQASWTPPSAGSYVLRIGDPKTGAVTARSFYASSGLWYDQPWSLEKPEKLELVIDKDAYSPGETARILVKSPFAGTLVVTYEQDSVLTSSIFQMEQNTLEILLPIEERLSPNVYCVASVIRPVKPAEKWLPHRAYGMVNVPLKSESRELAVNITSPVEVLPESRFAVQLAVMDKLTSEPVPAEVTLWAVDEGILTLTDYQTPVAAKFFYAARRLMVQTADFFSDLMPDLISGVKAKSASGGDGGSELKRLSPVSGERVRPVSLWLGTLMTASDGTSSATFEVPQYMGRLRVMASAANNEKFGKGESTVFVRSPIMVKDNLPRFLAPGDQARVPFVLYNNTDASRQITFTLETSEPLKLLRFNKEQISSRADRLSRMQLVPVTVGPRSSVVQTVTFDALNATGVSPVTFTASSGSERYSDNVEIPVRPAFPSIYQSGVATVAPGEQQDISIAGGVFVQGTTSGTLVASDLPTIQLSSSLRYLVHYPYGCIEQTVSGAFPLIHLKALAQQVEPGRFAGEAITHYVQAGVDRVLSMQTSSGGLSMWPNHTEPYVWGSIYGAHFLIEAKKAGYEVAEDYLQQLLTYLTVRLAGQGEGQQDDLLTERAYTCYVLALAGRKNMERMDYLYEQREMLTPTAGALLASAYMVSGGLNESRELLQGAQKRLENDQTTSTRQSGGILHSPARETAILLSAYLDSDASAPEIPRLVTRLSGMLDRRGYWGSTQENAFAIFALGRYMHQIQGRHGGVRGTVISEGEAHDFSSSSPLSLTSIKGQQVTVRNDGNGPAYVWWAMEGVPEKVDYTTVSQGLKVSRRYVTRDGEAILAEDFKQGQLVIVEIDISADRNMQNVVIEDLLPAGLEIENANLASSEHMDGGTEDDGSGLLVRRTEARDDRMIVFVDISAGSNQTRVFKYAARAVTAGSFVLPPVQASCMYDPDVQARSGAGMISVREK